MKIENGIKIYENIAGIVDPGHSCLVVYTLITPLPNDFLAGG